MDKVSELIMGDKTCGECRFYKPYNDAICPYTHRKVMPPMTRACSRFEQPTNGDKIRQGSNRALAEIFDDIDIGNRCKYCIHRTAYGACELNPTPYSSVGYVDAEDCINGFESWLNAPAESEVEDE